MRTPLQASIRHAEPADVEALTDIWNEGATRRISAATLHEKLWEDADVSPNLRLVATERSGAIVGFAAGVNRSTTVDGSAIKMIAVTRSRQHRGIGSSLLGATTAALEATGTKNIRLGESPPNYLQPGVDADSEAIAFFERSGFEYVGTVYDMQVNLQGRDFSTTQSETALRESGISVRRVVPSDVVGLSALINAHWPPWQGEVSNALHCDPLAIHIAVDESAGPGFVVAFATHSANNKALGWFGPMGTRPEYRGRGLGAVLLRRCLVDLARSGYPDATISWVGPVSFYERAVGAYVSRTFSRYEKRVPTE